MLNPLRVRRNTDAGDGRVASPANEPLRLDILFASTDSAEVGSLIAAIRSAGLEVHELDAASTTSDGEQEWVGAVAVLITAGLLEGHTPDELKAITDRYAEVVPVWFLEGKPTIYDDLTQIMVAHLGVAEAARQIGLIVHHGGRTIAYWKRLTDQAIRWRDEGAGLLHGPEIPDAHAVTHSASANSFTHRHTVLAYLNASRAAVARRHRIWNGVISAAAAILTIVLVVAVVQAVSAYRAQLAAERAAQRADADRIGRLATSLLDADPDLPTILAATAYGLAPTDLAHQALLQAAAKAWPHTSIPIDYTPRTVTAARDGGLFAIGEDSAPVVHLYRVDRDSATEVKPITVAVPTSQAVKAYLSPDGKNLAATTADPGTLDIVPVDSGATNVPGWVTAADRLFGWIDNTRILLGRNDQLLSVAVDGATEVIANAAPGEAFDAAAISGNGRFVVAATAKSLTRVDLRREMPDQTVAVADAWDLTINNTGTLAVAATTPLATTVEFGSGTGKVGQLDAYYPSSVAFVTDQLVSSGTRDGMFSLFPFNEHYDKWGDSSFRAHLDGSVRPVMVGKKLVTLGADHYLRLWEVSDDDGTQSYISRANQAGYAGLSKTTGVDIAPRLSARNQIRYAGADDIVVAGKAGYATVLNADTLQEIDPPARIKQRAAGRCSDCLGVPGYFAGLFTELLVSRNGRFIAGVNSDHTTISERLEQTHYFDAPSHTSITWKSPEMTADGGEGVGAVSDDGSKVVVADDSVVATLSAVGHTIDSHKYPIQRRPVGLRADGPTPAIVVTADGYVRDSAGTESRLALDNETELAACEMPATADYVCTTTEGRLLRISGLRVAEIGSAGAGMNPFAVRLSADGHRIAVLGQSGLSILEIDSGAVLFMANRFKERMITDVAFSPSGNRVLAVRADGTVAVVTDAGPSLIPRSLTSEEARLLDVSGGGH